MPRVMELIFQQAVDDVMNQRGIRSASGSQDDHVLDGGGRRKRLRFEYSSNSKSAFVELHPAFKPTPAEFKVLLEAVPGVTEVEWQTTKTSQDNVGNHYS